MGRLVSFPCGRCFESIAVQPALYVDLSSLSNKYHKTFTDREGTFSKCAYCTSKDKKRELCHLPGQESPGLVILSTTIPWSLPRLDGMLVPSLTVSFVSSCLPRADIPMVPAP